MPSAKYPTFDGQPHQLVADSDLVDQRCNLPVTLEEVMIEVLKMVSGHGECDCLSAKVLGPLPQRHLVPALGHAQRRRESGVSATNDSDMLLFVSCAHTPCFG